MPLQLHYIYYLSTLTKILFHINKLILSTDMRFVNIIFIDMSWKFIVQPHFKPSLYVAEESLMIGKTK